MKSHALRAALGLMARCGEGWSVETGCTLLTASLVIRVVYFFFLACSSGVAAGKGSDAMDQRGEGEVQLGLAVCSSLVFLLSNHTW